MGIERGGLLQGMKVIEVTDGRAGAFAGRLFSALGAEVIKVEPPNGSGARHLSPLSTQDGSQSLAFLYLNLGKRCIGIDFRSPMAAEAFRRLLMKSDVFLCDWEPTRLAGLGLSYDSISQSHPHLVTGVVRPFGLSGPWAEWRASDLNVVHASGLGFITRQDALDRHPLKPAGYLSDYFAGAHVASAVLAAIYHHRESGVGDVAEVSQYELMLSTMYIPYGRYINDPQAFAAGAPPSVAGMMPCLDGHVVLTIHTEGHWEALIDLLGNPDWSRGDWWRDLELRRGSFEFLYARLAEWLSDKRKRDVVQQCQSKHVPAAMMATPEDVATDAQLSARHFFATWHAEPVGKVALPGVPFRVDGTEQHQEGGFPTLHLLDDDGAAAVAFRTRGEGRQ